VRRRTNHIELYCSIIRRTVLISNAFNALPRPGSACSAIEDHYNRHKYFTKGINMFTKRR
jgi:hypothetical protein